MLFFKLKEFEDEITLDFLAIQRKSEDQMKFGAQFKLWLFPNTLRIKKKLT